MLSVALTSFVTGITEPLEYSFLFVAPALYVVHMVLTGVSMAVTWALGVHDGFSFSAGLIDYVINWGLATKPWLIVPIGLCFAVVYYVVFRFAITKFDLPTPGRESDEEIEVSVRRGEVTLRGTVPSRSIRRMAEEFFADLPGVKHVTNLLYVDAH